MKDIYYYDHQKEDLVRETVMGEALIKWAYQDASMSVLSKALFHNAFFSKLLGLYFNSGFSKPKIASAIKDLAIDPREFKDPVESFKTFNQFFYRHLALDTCRPYDRDDRTCVMPADGRVYVYPDFSEDTLIPVKGTSYSVKTFLDIHTDTFANGSLAVIRLCPADYHRYHYPCAGTLIAEKEIPGYYHSVNPLALAMGVDVFCQNKRAYSILENPEFGKIAYVEVGAFGVGSIIRSNDNNTVNKMDERGYFAFGGSTIVLVFQKDAITFDERLVKHSNEGYETLVKVGDILGLKASQ